MAELTVLEEKLPEVAGLAMAAKAATEVSSLGHWSVLRKLNERARRDDVGQLVEWALPIHQRHFQDVLDGSLELAAQRIPTNHPDSGGDPMAEPVPAGSDVSAGTYQCTQCGYELDVQSTTHLPPCPSCGNASWNTESGGDSVNDPYPDRG